jgi:hypothetical protein
MKMENFPTAGKTFLYWNGACFPNNIPNENLRNDFLGGAKS